MKDAPAVPDKFFPEYGVTVNAIFLPTGIDPTNVSVQVPSQNVKGDPVSTIVVVLLSSTHTNSTDLVFSIVVELLELVTVTGIARKFNNDNISIGSVGGSAIVLLTRTSSNTTMELFLIVRNNILDLA